MELLRFDTVWVHTMPVYMKINGAPPYVAFVGFVDDVCICGLPETKQFYQDTFSRHILHMV